MCSRQSRFETVSHIVIKTKSVGRFVKFQVL